ncbi:unnamed protein product [Caenorhabditis auriculariae]|uniref:Major sperm protein n=1 Tax=Caenorhabditis auriculariae TaxID=2777116 RepID=A0A8S1HAM3_9PELO|nr:unnamed protein product [Caenorhabditis auriculariae]
MTGQLSGNDKYATAHSDRESISTVQGMMGVWVPGSSPNRELSIHPRWVIFHSKTAYKQPLFTKIQLKNPDPFTIAFALKARQKIFKISHNHGILKPGEERAIKLFLLGSEDWPLGTNEYVQQKIRIAVENIRVPENITPSCSLEGSRIAKEVFRRSANEFPLERMYTKINVLLEKFEGDA